MVIFGQVVVGPPGSGKTTYCHGMQMFLRTIGRKCEIVNLDFANDKLPYEPAIDVRNLVALENVMDELNLGPNGGLVYCMEYLLENSEWLQEKLDELKCHYIIFDCPGQVELYSHYTCTQDLIKKLQQMDCRLSSVNLVDSFYCCEPATFISAVLTVAITMLRLGLPHVNVLSKIDLLPRYGSLPFTLDFFTELVDLTPLVRYINAPRQSQEELRHEDLAAYDIKNYNNDDDDDEEDKDSGHTVISRELVSPAMTPGDVLRNKHKRLSHAICDVLTDQGLVSFLALNIQDPETVARVLASVDNANGYNYAQTASQEYLQSRPAKGKISTFADQQEQLEQNEMVDGLLRMTANSQLELGYTRSLEIMEKYDPDNDNI